MAPVLESMRIICQYVWNTTSSHSGTLSLPVTLKGRDAPLPTSTVTVSTGLFRVWKATLPELYVRSEEKENGM